MPLVSQKQLSDNRIEFRFVAAKDPGDFITIEATDLEDAIDTLKFLSEQNDQQIPVEQPRGNYAILTGIRWVDDKEYAGIEVDESTYTLTKRTNNKGEEAEVKSYHNFGTKWRKFKRPISVWEYTDNLSLANSLQNEAAWKERLKWIQDGTDEADEIDENGEVIYEVEEPEIITPLSYGQNLVAGETVIQEGDFSEDGWYLPLDCPDNSTDYQDDFDPQDYQGEQWNSDDGIDDHHYQESLYKAVGITETPCFNEHGMIEWTSEAHDESIPEPINFKDAQFVQDAHNWLEKERLLRETKEQWMHAEIIKAFPLSPEFRELLKEHGLTYELALERMDALAESGIFPEPKGVKFDGSQVKGEPFWTEEMLTDESLINETLAAD